jgi:superfamily II DNA/RNA helicase
MTQDPVINTFDELPLIPGILKALATHGYVRPMPVQCRGLRPLLDGQSAVIRARTGTGKTALFALPILQTIQSGATKRSLILAPTRELAHQIFEEIEKLGENCDKATVACLVGGSSIKRQVNALADSNILVMTPGRAYDALDSGLLPPSEFGIVVVDEADLMLDIGDIETCARILKAVVQKQTQLMFCSATFSDDVRKLCNQFRRGMTSIDIPMKSGNIGEILEWAIDTFPENHLQLSVRIIRQRQAKSCIVFCNHRQRVDEVADGLNQAGLRAVPLHGDLEQHERNGFMKTFRSGEATILVATDLASRGIDIPGLELVINYDLPYEGTDYVHRYGRTGRVGKGGLVVNFYNGKALRRIENIEKRTGRKMQRATHATIMSGRTWDAERATGAGKPPLKSVKRMRLHIDCGSRRGMNFTALKRILRDDCGLHLKSDVAFMDVKEAHTLVIIRASVAKRTQKTLRSLTFGERELTVTLREASAADGTPAEKRPSRPRGEGKRVGKSKPDRRKPEGAQGRRGGKPKSGGRTSKREHGTRSDRSKPSRRTPKGRRGGKS